MKRNDHLGVIGTFLLLTILVGPTGPSFAQETVRTSMDLKQLMDETLRNNPEIVAARKGWEAAETRITQAASLDDPEFTYQAWAVPLSDPLNLRKANPNIFGIQQKLPFPGKLRLKGEIASEEAKMAEARYRAKEREIIARLKNAYAGLFMASRAIQIQSEHLELVKQILRIAEIRYAVGRVPQQDVFKAQVAQSEVLNNLIAVGQERQVAEAMLNALLNRPSIAPFPPPPELIPDIPAGEWRVDDLIQQALQLRPELKEMEAAIRGAERTLDLADRNRKYPDFFLSWQYWFAPEGEIQDSYGAMINITIPFSLWTINKHSKEVEEAGLTVAKSTAEYQAMKNMVFFEIRDAFAKLEAARQQLRLFRDALIPQTEQSYKATLAAYEVGKVEFIGLMEAARSTRDIKLGYYRALVDFEQRLADLERAVGRDLIR
jgi:outer membrane protein TolC